MSLYYIIYINPVAVNEKLTLYRCVWGGLMLKLLKFQRLLPRKLFGDSKLWKDNVLIQAAACTKSIESLLKISAPVWTLLEFQRLLSGTGHALFQAAACTKSMESLLKISATVSFLI